jgi:hypothetical protein
MVSTMQRTPATERYAPGMPSILWRRIDRTSYERCTLEDTATGHRLAGTVLLVDEGVPYDIRYTIVTNPQWQPVTVGVNVSGVDNDRTLALSGDANGSWSVGDSPVLELFGATDVDFGFSPGTNTIPIKRLGLDVGETAEITAIRVDFPQRDIEKVTQTYERLAERRYRYRAGEYSADLTLNEHGLVIAYPAGWMTEAEA